MSWDLIAMAFPDVALVSEIPDDFKATPLGPRKAVIAKIISAFPTADFRDPAWGVIDGEGWSIEVSLREEEACDSFALHVRGGGARAVEAVAAILEATGVRGVDMQTGEFFDPEGALASFGEWQAYRDHVVEVARQPRPRGLFSRLFGK